MLYYIHNDDLHNFFSIIQGLNIEICGTFVESYNRLVPSFYERGDQNSCLLSGYSSYPFVWHSHSHISKGYPSTQDIIKTINKKNKNVKYQFIFTIWGIWQMSSYDQKTMNETEKNNTKELINSINNELYKITDSGRGNISKDYMEKIILYINTLETELKKYGFIIYFTPWENIGYNPYTVI